MVGELKVKGKVIDVTFPLVYLGIQESAFRLMEGLRDGRTLAFWLQMDGHPGWLQTGGHLGWL